MGTDGWLEGGGRGVGGGGVLTDGAEHENSEGTAIESG